ncbi:hypothetical protein VP01_2298g1 [Puccinia sorghi]|uniref:Uncharacterized protein n=1 Tax=Puccinia sorghi TaxID=27349 RepID=A0A0L6V9U8_9BASI|nr:hypothetical protein VP01_2298g1 [Puccinia sorghi]
MPARIQVRSSSPTSLLLSSPRLLIAFARFFSPSPFAPGQGLVAGGSKIRSWSWFLLDFLVYILSATGTLPASKALAWIVSREISPSHWEALTESDQQLGYGKKYLDEHGLFNYYYNCQKQLNAWMVPATEDTRACQEGREIGNEATDQPDQKHLNPPSEAPRPTLQVSNPIQRSIVFLTIIDIKHGRKLPNQRICGGSSIHSYKLAEDCDPSQIILSVDGVVDNRVHKPQRPRPALPSQRASALGPETNGNSPESSTEEESNIFRSIWKYIPL